MSSCSCVHLCMLICSLVDLSNGYLGTGSIVLVLFVHVYSCSWIHLCMLICSLVDLSMFTWLLVHFFFVRVFTKACHFVYWLTGQLFT